MTKKTNRRPAKKTSRGWFYGNITVAIAIILIAIGGFIIAFQKENSPAPLPSEVKATETTGQSAIDFSLSDLNGETVKLSDYQGQVVMVNFWASWCPPCTAELPTIQAFYDAHKADGFVVLAVNAHENPADVRGFINSKGFTFPVLLDSNAGVMNKYGIRALPMSFIIDKNGNIQYIHRGGIDTETLKAKVEPLL